MNNYTFVVNKDGKKLEEVQVTSAKRLKIGMTLKVKSDEDRDYKTYFAVVSSLTEEQVAWNNYRGEGLLEIREYAIVNIRKIL